jgi:Grx4 family monothiol glutaredoxin
MSIDDDGDQCGCSFAPFLATSHLRSCRNFLSHRHSFHRGLKRLRLKSLIHKIMSGTLKDISSGAALEQCFTSSKKLVLLFGADWHEATPMLKMVLGALAKEKTELIFANVDAENSELSDTYNVTMVPTIVLLNGGADKIMDKLEGVMDASQVTVAVQNLVQAAEGVSAASTGNASTATTPVVNPEKALNERLERLVHGDTVMLFMKGTPSAPRCGFSRQAVELLNEQKVPFASFDILSDEDVRQGLKKYSDWPTYPQIYVKGELMGGLDILKETASEGPLKEQWGIDDNALIDDSESLEDRLKKLVNRHKVMLFMKGLPSAPQCGFSRQIVEILDESSVPYDAFNILEDEEVRQGLKEFSDWPTYPQLYVNGDLVGGLDIVKELKESSELEDVLNA